MKIRCLLKHMVGQNVLVDSGATYKVGQVGEQYLIVDEEGKPLDVPDDDAEVLLENRDAWRAVVAKAPVKAEESEKTPEEPEKDAEPPKEPEEPKTPAEPPKEPEEPTTDSEGTTEEWPDPTEEMDIEYLKKMADAYEIPYAVNIGKATLIKRIMKAMYPED